ncbi:MAG: AAA family ATPase [Prolixibacteraceae bacterium]|jgi:exodeoxyribonuclease-5|nr:AAA family ATPase [Prolixibacteraceae bacterium]
MFEKKLSQIISQNLKVHPTVSQQTAIDEISRFLYDDDQYSMFLLKGYAGTGKTLLVSTLVRAVVPFRIKTELLAPTGRAAKVLSSYAKKSAYTIHKKIYRQKSNSDGSGNFVLDYNKSSNTLFIVDESSMISNSSIDQSIFGSGRLLEDLIEYVYNGKNCRLMLVGDTAQLPPVGLTISPALDPVVLKDFNMTLFSAVLSDVVRQANESGILHNATALRYNIKHKRINTFFPIKLEGFDDIFRIGGDELIESISECYDKYGESETIVVTRSNKRANQFNEGIRRTILWRESELTAGDMLMIVKNNYHWVDPDGKLDFIANGDIAKVIRVHRNEDLYGFKFANVTLQFIDYEELELECKIFIDTLTIETASFGKNDNQRLYDAIQEDYIEITDRKKRWKKIKEDPYFNALQVKYAYSVTCHKAQGGQWDAVFIDHGYLLEEMINIDFLRWFYTAFTRPKARLYLVNFDKKFFGEIDEAETEW